jgi:hypothetical protein
VIGVSVFSVCLLYAAAASRQDVPFGTSVICCPTVCTCLSFLCPTVGHWQPHVCKASEAVATQTLLLEGPLGFSGLVDEVGGGMVRRE